jgi:hypothetical protein
MGWHTSHCSLVNTDLPVSLLPAYRFNPISDELIPDRRQHSTPVASTSLRRRVGSIVAIASHLYVDLGSLALPPNCVSTLRALALISHLISRSVFLKLKPLPVATTPAEVMVVGTQA